MEVQDFQCNFDIQDITLRISKRITAIDYLMTSHSRILD